MHGLGLHCFISILSCHLLSNSRTLLHIVLITLASGSLFSSPFPVIILGDIIHLQMSIPHLGLLFPRLLKSNHLVPILLSCNSEERDNQGTQPEGPQTPKPSPLPFNYTTMPSQSVFLVISVLMFLHSAMADSSNDNWVQVVFVAV